MTGRIEDIRDPNLFQRLVQALFIAQQPNSFEAVDDSSGDRGNDGYDASQGALTAIYCPERDPTRARYLSKGREDLAKAVALRGGGQYRIEEWRFVTPRALPEEVQATLREEAERSGLRARFFSAEHLESWYLQYPYLHPRFPELSYPRNEGLLRDIHDKVNALWEDRQAEHGSPEAAPVSAPAAPPPEADLYAVRILAGYTSPALAAIQGRLHGGVAGARFELERFRLDAASPIDRMAALMVEAEYELEQHAFDNLAGLARRGQRMASIAGRPAEQAVFAAQEALAREMILVSRRHELDGRLMAMKMSGAPLVTVSEAEEHDRQVNKELREIGNLFRDAYRLADEGRNLAAQFSVLIHYANALTNSVFPDRMRAVAGLTVDLHAVESRAKKQVEHAYEIALLAAQVMNDQGLVALAYSNFANNLRTFGDTERALAHAEHALDLLGENGDSDQRARTTRLIGLLKADLAEARVDGGPGSGPK